MKATFYGLLIFAASMLSLSPKKITTLEPIKEINYLKNNNKDLIIINTMIDTIENDKNKIREIQKELELSN